MTANLFDNFSLAYDRMISWPKRLPKEAPFFEALFCEHQVKSVLDTACGTGWHTINFAQRGYLASGTDLSPAMIDVARANAQKEKVPVDFKVAGFTDLTNVVKEGADAITCLGNSLPHLLTDKELETALAQFHSILNGPGILIIQIRNYSLAVKENKRFMPLNHWQDENEEFIFFRMQDFLPEKVEFSIVTFHRCQGREWDYQVNTNQLRPLDIQQLTSFLNKAGFEQLTYYGDYQFHPFDIDNSTDLIIVAKKD